MFTKGRHTAIASFMIIFAFLFIATACSTDQNGSDATAPSTETEQPAGSTTTNTPAPQMEEKIKFTYYVNEITYNIIKSGIQWPHIQEAAHAEVELVNAGDRGQYDQNLHLLMASGQLPDALWIKVALANQYGAEGALLDLKPLIDEHAPNMKAFIENDPGYRASVTADDGGIYSIMNMIAAIPNFAWYYREDWADDLGIAAPETLDQFTDMLRLVKANNPGGEKYFYPLTVQHYLHMRLAFYNVFDFAIYGNGVEDIYSPYFKQYVEYLRMLYEEELFDPEAAKGAISEDALKAKMLNNNAFIFFRATANAEDYTNTGKELNPAYRFTSMPPVIPVHGNDRSYWIAVDYSDSNAVAITKDAKDPVGIIKFFDFFFTQEGMDLMNWGVEGESYVIENGQKKFLVSSAEVQGGDPNSPDPHWMMLLQGSFTFPGPSDHVAWMALSSEFQQSLRSIFSDYASKNPQLLLVKGEDIDRRAELEAVVLPKRDKWIVDFVTGEKPMSEWDAFLDDMTASGFPEMIEILKRSLAN